MKTYEYRGFDLSGQMARGLVEALDVKEARERLAERGILPENLAEAGAERAPAWFRRGAATGVSVRANSYRELGALLKAGVSMVPALQITINAAENAGHAFNLARVRDRIREGSSLTEAMAAAEKDLPAFERAALTAGERSGTLDLVLERLADHLDEHQKARERLAAALIYPAFVIVLAIVIAIGLLGFAIPSLGKMFAETKIPLPVLTRVLMAVGNHAAAILLPIVVGLAMGIYWFVRSLRAHAAFRERFHRTLFRWPVLGQNLKLLVNARFAQTLGLLMRGGVGAVEAMDLAGAATGNAWLAALSREEANEVRHGKTISNAIKSIPPFSRALAGWMEAGEASGNLPDLLDRAGARYQQQWGQHLTRCLNILEPLLIVIVGGFVLMIALAVLLPILSLNRTMM